MFGCWFCKLAKPSRKSANASTRLIWAMSELALPPHDVKNRHKSEEEGRGHDAQQFQARPVPLDRASCESGEHSAAANHEPLQDNQAAADAVADLATLGFAAIQTLEQGAPIPNGASELLDRTKPFLPARNDIPGILEALFPVLNDENRPNALKLMGVAFWPGVKRLTDAALDRCTTIT